MVTADTITLIGIGIIATIIIGEAVLGDIRIRTTMDIITTALTEAVGVLP